MARVSWSTVVSERRANARAFLGWTAVADGEPLAAIAIRLAYRVRWDIWRTCSRGWERRTALLMRIAVTLGSERETIGHKMVDAPIDNLDFMSRLDDEASDTIRTSQATPGLQSVQRTG